MARPAAEPAPPSGTTTVALAVAVLSGAMVAVQQRINGQLAVDLRSAILAAVVSFGTGLVLVTAVVLARPASRRAVRRVGQVPWWMRLGGLGGALVVGVGAAATPEIGVALLTVGLVAGQTSGGLLVDRFGLAPGGRHSLTVPRVAGAVLCLVAALAGALGRDAREADVLLLVLVVVAGFGIAVQQAVNGRIRGTTGDAAVATLVNFVVGTAALVAGWALATAARGLPVADWPGPDRWFLYLGGALGAGFVAAATVVVRRLGVLRLGLAVISGQLIGALALDVALPVTGREVAAATVAGALLTLVAVAVSGLGARRA